MFDKFCPTSILQHDKKVRVYIILTYKPEKHAQDADMQIRSFNELSFSFMNPTSGALLNRTNTP